MAVGYFYPDLTLTKCCLQEFESPPLSKINVSGRNVFGENQITDENTWMACWKTWAYFYELREASDGLQKELWEKYRAIQIISEIQRLVAKEQRPTGLGATFGVQILTCYSRYCTHVSHNPGILKAHCFLIKLHHTWLLHASEVKSGWNFFSCCNGDILFPEVFIYCTAIITKPVTGWIFTEMRACVHFRRGLWLPVSV